LNAHNDGSSYVWSNGNNGRYLFVTNSGEYSVIVTDADNCIGYDTIQVVVNSSPEVSLGEDIDACETSPVILKAYTPNGESILWSTDETTQTITVAENNNYWLQLTSGNGCSNKDTINIEFYNMPAYPFQVDSISSCFSVTLDAQNIDFKYLWSNNSTARTLDIFESGTYNVEIYNYGCSITDEIITVIDPVPSVNLGNDIELCESYATILDAGNQGTKYLWSTGSTSQTIIVNTSGYNSVVVTNSLGCSNSDDINIIALPSPIFDLGTNQTICNDVSLILDPGINAQTYKWYNETVLISTKSTLEVDEPGLFWLDAINSNGCSYSDTVTIDRNPDTVEADFLIASEINPLDTIQIIDLSLPGTGDYLWHFGDGGISTEYNPQHIYYISGNYTITLNIENGGCSTFLSKFITVNESSKSIEEEKFIISAEKEPKILSAKLYPNPNKGQFICDVELSESSDVYIQIYNLNGILLYNNKLSNQSHMQNEFSLNNFPAGIYIVKINVEDEKRVLKFVKY